MSEDAKKEVTHESKLFNDITIIIDETMKPSPIKGLVARKLEQANASLKKMKGLPKI